MKPNHVWIIEMKSDIDGQWEPTVGCGIDYPGAKRELLSFYEACPDDKFRIAKYVSARPKQRRGKKGKR